MSTNFYAERPGHLTDDGGYSPALRLHIGRRGASYTLTAYANPQRDFDGGRLITSWADWKMLLSSDEGWVIYDEYLTVFTLAELVAEFESAPSHRRGFNSEYAAARSLNSYLRSRIDVDSGFAMLDYEYS